VKRGDGEDYVLNGKSNGAGSLHETDLFKIAVRNLSEQEILSNFQNFLDTSGN
jgi:hypothetical protein